MADVDQRLHSCSIPSFQNVLFIGILDFYVIIFIQIIMAIHHTDLFALIHIGRTAPLQTLWRMPCDQSYHCPTVNSRVAGHDFQNKAHSNRSRAGILPVGEDAF